MLKKILPVILWLLIFGESLSAKELPKIAFEDVTKQVGLQLKGRCATWADLDNDGWPDLVADGQIWRNQQGKSFFDMTEKSGISGQAKSPCVAADFNGDGLADIYFVKKNGAFYLNQGNFKFKKGVAAANPYPEWPMAAGAADLDNDGYVDIYVANYEIWKKQIGYPDIILQNIKGELKLKFCAGEQRAMRGRGVTCCDFNNDGKMDVYISNYRLMPNFLWINFGNWKLVNMARQYGCAGSERKNKPIRNRQVGGYGSSGHTIGSVWADFDNDTYFDLFVGNFSHPPLWQDRPQFLKNGGPENKFKFIDKSAVAKIPWQESYANPVAGDINNDGLVDLFFTTVYKGDNSRLFRNDGNWKFTDITPESKIVSFGTYQAAFADFDNDGRLDLLTCRKLYRNVGPVDNWLKVRLAGAPPNTTAVGTKVFVSFDGKTLVRQVEAGTGTGSQNDLTLHFGLGKVNTEKVKIKAQWPDGSITHAEAKPNQHLLLKQIVHPAAQ